MVKLRTFPADIRSRMPIVIEVAKHIPANVLLQLIPSATSYGESVYTRTLGSWFEQLSGTKVKPTDYIDLLKNAALIEPDREFVSNRPLSGAYVLTAPIGRQYSAQIAAHTLNYASNRDFSLIDIFGKGYKVGNPTTHKRISILVSLAGRDSARKTHLEYDAGGNLSYALSCMSDNGFIELQVQDDIKEVVVKSSRFTGSLDDIEDLCPEAVLVAKAQTNGKYTVAAIAKYTGLSAPTITHSLGILNNKGLIQVTDSFLNNRRVDVSLTDKGKDVLGDFYLPLEQIMLDEHRVDLYEYEVVPPDPEKKSKWPKYSLDERVVRAMAPYSQSIK